MSKKIKTLEFSSFVSEVEFKIGNTVWYKITGDNKAIINHVNGNEQDCVFCKEFKDLMPCTKFQRRHGLTHELIDKYTNTWRGLDGYGMPVDELSPEFAKSIRQIYLK